MTMRNTILAVMLAGSCATYSQQQVSPESDMQKVASSPSCVRQKAYWKFQPHKSSSESSEALVKRTLDGFEALLENLPPLQANEREINAECNWRENIEQRSYERFISQAALQGYTIFDINKKGSMPDVVLLGWKHTPSYKHMQNFLTYEMQRGLEFIIDSYREQDFVLPEGERSGIIVRSRIYEQWPDMAQFLVQHFPSSVSERTARELLEKVKKAPVYIAGADNINPNIDIIKYYQLSELLSQLIEKKAENNYEEGIPLQEAYLHQSKELFPAMDQEKHLTPFPFVCFIHFLHCDETERREMNHLIPTIKGLVASKRPGQVIYVPWGSAHVTRGKITSAMREAGIGFVALVPHDDEHMFEDGCAGNERL